MNTLLGVTQGPRLPPSGSSVSFLGLRTLYDLLSRVVKEERQGIPASHRLCTKEADSISTHTRLMRLGHVAYPPCCKEQ